MIKELTTALLVSAMSNVIVPNTTRGNADITTNPNNIQLINTAQTETTVYRVKEFSNSFDLTYATVDAKGYHRIYINQTTQTINARTEYYFRIEYEDGQENDFTFTDLAINLRGYEQDSQIDASVIYEDYDLYALNTTNATIDSFIDSPTYTISQLNGVHNVGGWTTLPHTTIDTVQANCTLTVNSKYKYLKWEIQWNATDFAPFIENAPLILNIIINYYTSATVVYSWTVDIEYNVEVIDLPGLLFTMIGMPFAWISTAFNVTLFSGTAYAVNISRLFFEIICTLILIIVLRKVIK